MEYHRVLFYDCFFSTCTSLPSYFSIFFISSAIVASICGTLGRGSEMVSGCSAINKLITLDSRSLFYHSLLWHSLSFLSVSLRLGIKWQKIIPDDSKMLLWLGKIPEEMVELISAPTINRVWLLFKKINKGAQSSSHVRILDILNFQVAAVALWNEVTALLIGSVYSLSYLQIGLLASSWG